MKKTTLFLPPILMWVVLALAGCAPEAVAPDLFISTNTSALNYDQMGGTGRVTVTASSADWTADSDADWLELTKDGDILVITAPAYEGGKERTATVTVRIGRSHISKSISIFQSGSEPVVKLEKQEYLFDNKGVTDEVIPVFSNSKSWTVEQIETTEWLSYVADSENGQIRITIQPLDKNTENSSENRKTTLIVSNESAHAVLNITQTGWVLFSDILIGKNLTRAEIQEYEESKGHVRDKEYENRFSYWIEEGVDPPVMAFKTDALQSVYAVYEFDNNDVNKFVRVRIQAGKEQTFNQEDFDSWILSKGYQKISQLITNTKQGYYKEEKDRTYYALLDNRSNAYNNGYDQRGAYAHFSYDMNEIEVDRENEYLFNYPVRNTEMIRNTAFKQKEVIEWEKSHGMVLDTSNEQTKKSSISGYTDLYESMIFVPEDGQSNHKNFGDLYQSGYFFNIPGYRDPGLPDSPPDGYTDEIAYAGTVAMRIDFYYGAPGYKAQFVKKDWWEVPPGSPTEYYELRLNSSLLTAANRIGFVTRYVGDIGEPTYFQRGKEEITYTMGLDNNGEMISVYYFLKDAEMIKRIFGESIN